MNYSPTKETSLRTEIVKVGRLLYKKGLIVAGDGNISARLDETHILCTPSGLCKGMMTADHLLIIDLQSNRTDTPTAANKHLRPTSEMAMHLEVYKNRPDVQAVVHAHPPHVVALSIANVSLAECMLPEVIVTLGLIQTTPYATPSSEENAAAIRSVIRNHDAIVLQRHGALTVGQSPMDAFHKTETVEQIGRITYMVKTLGGGAPLPPHQVEKLLAQRNALNAGHDGEEEEFCKICGVCHPQNLACPTPSQSPESGRPNDALIDLITREVMARLAQKSR